MKIALVNTPFASLGAPSLALTQLRAVLDARFGDDVSTDLHYLNHDFGLFFGPQLYTDIAVRTHYLLSGIGDWLFRRIAFPEVADNATEYYQRFYPRPDAQTRQFCDTLERRRADLRGFLDRLIDDYHLADYDVVGLTSMFAQSVACFALARLLKLRRPTILTVMGGANCEGPMGRAIARNVPAIDFVCSGPGLRSLPELIRRVREGTGVDAPLAGVFAGAHSTVAKGIVPITGAELGEDAPIDEDIPLNYDSFLDVIERRFDRRDLQLEIMVETSRGCWWGQKAHCTFCGLNGSTMQYRSMSPPHAIALFQSLFRYADRCSLVSCVDNILPKSYLRDVLPHLHTPEGMTIFYEVKADLEDDDLRVLFEAGVRRVQPGIESLSTSTLKLMRKGTSAFTNLRLLMSCRLFDVFPLWNLLMGFPGEERSVFDKYVRDIPLLLHLTPPSGAYPVRFDRFSPYFVLADEYHLDLKPLDMYEYVYPFDGDSLRELAYFFADQNFEAPYQMAMLTGLQPVRTAVDHWQVRFDGLDGREPAELFFVPDSGNRVIYDSRSGEAREHVLSEADAAMLARLTHVTTVRALDEANGSAGGTAASLASLRERGLIFEEGERLTSLVLARVPPRMSKRTDRIATTAVSTR